MQSLSSIEKATEVLFFLNAHAGPCGVSKVADALGLPKASAHRLLKSLRFRNLVRRDERGQYELGEGLLALGIGAGRSDPLIRAARPTLRDEAASVGETFFLVAERGGELLVLDKVEGHGFLRVSPQVGARVPVHATAVGRLYLAYAPDRVRFGPSDLIAFTKRTPATPNRLKKCVKLVCERGVSVSDEEWIEGLSAVAAPVWLERRLLGAVVVACVAPRLRDLGFDRMGEVVLSASQRIARELEGTR